MQTNELLNKYVHEKCGVPDEDWKRLVWFAANLIRSAMKIRNTYRDAHNDTKKKSEFYQPELI